MAGFFIPALTNQYSLDPSTIALKANFRMEYHHQYHPPAQV